MLAREHRETLLQLARESIRAGLRERCRVPCVAYPRDALLDAAGASFVTLRRRGELRGCCGSLEPHGTLAEDVWRNAWTSAFADPRFAPLLAEEYPDIDVHISVLSPLEPLPLMSEAELLAQLRPGIDGLVLRHDGRQATFLPAVWEQLPAPADFLRHLKLKGGWSADFWSPDLRVWRYTTESFGRE